MPASFSRKRALVGTILLVGLLVLLVQDEWACRGEMTAIRLYQQVGAPVTRHVVRCRYDPSCSHFAIYALERNGFWKGNVEIAKRLMLCSPVGLLVD
jgi:putative membrane protein insertion efficiency factor